MASLPGAGSVAGQDSDVSVTVEDQESDGESVVIKSLRTDRDARLRIFSDVRNDQGVNIVYAYI